MGDHQVRAGSNAEEMRGFTRAVLADLEALKLMLERGMFETGIQRVGAEQELALVDPAGRPTPVSAAVLEQCQDPRLTTELAVFNLEANLAPQTLGGPFLGHLEKELDDVIAEVAESAAAADASVLLTGILPSLLREDLSLRNMTPKPRYRQLNDGLVALGGGEFSIFIRGVDELELISDNVMFEAANTSFQLHLQVGPDDFARRYNLAQLITAPLLAAAANSPMFLGKRLWHETRVALFERSVDARSGAARERGRLPRVTFGGGWLEGSVLALFQDAAARFPVVLTCESDPPPVARVESGEAVKLSSLMLHNGTVWRWNRPCYGVVDGVAHLRIENRVLPAGPTVVDEVANAALFYGLMVGLDDLSAEIPSRLAFDAAKGNFVRAARESLGAQLDWLDRRQVGVRQLLLEELIPIARRGLASISTPEPEIDRYLGIIEARVESGRTGAHWLLEAAASLHSKYAPDGQGARLAAALVERQASGEPVHSWPPLAGAATVAAPQLQTVADLMTTDVFTVRPDDVVDLATHLMSWKHFRHVPVESDTGRLEGLVSHRALLRLQHRMDSQAEPVAVESIMDREPQRVAPQVPWTVALRLLLDSGRGCLLVVSGDRLVGIVTERDLLRAAAEHL